jgi:U3 small nucleolar RNA-associated protein 23
MHKYAQTFAFREPYQVLVDAEIVQDAVRFKMDLPAALERTLHGKVKSSTQHVVARQLRPHTNCIGIFSDYPVLHSPSLRCQGRPGNRPSQDL